MVDRVIVYPGQIPLDTDILSTNRNIMIALGYALRATLGTTIAADGLACLPTVPASMQVSIGQGSIITTTTVDGSAYGTIAADNADPLVKMGINPAGATLFTLSAPATSGQSINYLIEGQLVEADSLPLSLPYYNAANPSQPFIGPNNNQAQQNTVRTQRVGLQLKAGAPAGVGTQQTPTVDAGWVGLYIVTVNFAQTTITSTSILVYPGAPFIAAKIPQLAPLLSPVFTGFPLAPTPPSGDSTTRVATTAFVAQFGRVPANIAVFNASGTFFVPAGILRVKATVVGGGGAGMGCSSITPGTNFASGSGGGGGGLAIGLATVTPGASIPVVVGVGGAGNVTVATNPGTAGGSSSFITINATGGQPGTWASAASSAGGTPGLGTGGLANFSGGFGSDGQSGAFLKSGDGAEGPWGGRGRSSNTAVGGQAFPGGAPGAGGGGAYGSTNGFGGNGAAGIVIIEY